MHIWYKIHISETLHVLQIAVRVGLFALCARSLHRPRASYVKLRVAHAPGTTGTFSPPPRLSDLDMHHRTCVLHVPTCVLHVPWYMLGSQTSGFLWSRGRHSRHTRLMCNPQFYVSGKKPTGPCFRKHSYMNSHKSTSWSCSGNI